MDAQLTALTIQIVELQQRLESAERRLAASAERPGCGLRRGATRAVVVLGACAIVGLIFLDQSPAAPPASLPVSTLATRVAALEAKTDAISVDGDDLFIMGKNVHVVDGTGTSDSGSGLGNLTVGYNASRALFGDPDVRTGTHNLIVGDFNNYSGFGGFVAGVENEIGGDYSVVSGGAGNVSSGTFSSVSGGSSNDASYTGASVSGGTGNTASQFGASVSGGNGNVASGTFASVSGGQDNTATATASTVAGGLDNQATDFNATVAGGRDNVASGNQSTVSGGRDNESSGTSSTVGGGRFRSAAGEDDWAAGSLLEDD